MKSALYYFWLILEAVQENDIPVPVPKEVNKTPK
jgi:hypothetical protein